MVTANFTTYKSWWYYFKIKMILLVIKIRKYLACTPEGRVEYHTQIYCSQVLVELFISPNDNISNKK
jgi:hypothetical protein